MINLNRITKRALFNWGEAYFTGAAAWPIAQLKYHAFSLTALQKKMASAGQQARQ
jgi:hypothetical protein